ncbi:MAG: hypothetical protein ABF285_00375 [Pacificibacter sp.]|uniref:hypothetical protein n=1 Tax=Pacificibacter sp. TaxID=1917866 RepID=UPI00321B6DF9
MTNDVTKIQQLQALAELKLTTELANLDRIAAEKQAPNAVLDAIAREKRVQDQSANWDFDQATVSGMSEKWAIWAERETRNAMGELARIAQRYEAQMDVAQQAFGRTEALKALVQKAKDARGKTH